MPEPSQSLPSAGAVPGLALDPTTASVELLDLAWQVGVRYWRAARGDADSERLLAMWLNADLERARQCMVASKWGRVSLANYDDALHRPYLCDHALITFRRQWQETRAYLGRHLGIYMIDAIEIDSSEVLREREVLQQMLLACHEREVCCGASVHGPHQPELLTQIHALRLRNGQPLFRWVEADWTPADIAATRRFEALHRAGVRIALRVPLHLAPEQDRCLAALVQRYALPAPLLLMRLALSQPWASVVLLQNVEQPMLRRVLGVAADTAAGQVVQDDHATHDG